MRMDKLYGSIGLIWLFHLSGIIGIHLGYGDYFLPVSWLTLLLSALLLALNSDWNQKTWLIALAFIIGFGAEVIGVQTGLLFGEYAYGENLGYKLFGVPLMIGINWVVLGLLARDVSSLVIKNKMFRIVVSALIMVAFDVVIEPVAPKFDYWTFAGGLPTWKNYLGWFIVALPVQYLIEKSGLIINSTFARHLLLAQLVFFISFWHV